MKLTPPAMNASRSPQETPGTRVVMGQQAKKIQPDEGLDLGFGGLASIE